MMENVEKQVEIYIRKHGMIREGDVVTAGVSGGADSVCLLFVLCALRKKLGFSIRVCHVNHGLRGAEADADEAYVKELCERLDVPFRVFRENVELIAKKRKQSTEEAGRTVRRAAFEEMCGQDPRSKIATAHHRGDNVETVILNLARGTGLRGLCGIQPVRGKWIRPLLCLDREEIMEYLLQRKINWREDRTNSEDIYTRNRIRHSIVPALKSQVNKGVSAHIDELTQQLGEIWDYLERGTENAWKNCVISPDAEDECDSRGERKKDRFIEIGCTPFMKEMPAVQKQLLRRGIAAVRGSEKDIESVHVISVRELFDKTAGKSVDLPGGVKACRNGESVVILKVSENRESADGRNVKNDNCEIRLNIPGETFFPQTGQKIICRFVDGGDEEQAGRIPQKSYTKWIDYAIIKHGLCARTRRSGDYLTVSDDGKRQKLKSYFINEKIPRDKRENMLLIADGNHIVWIPGYRMSRLFRVGNSTDKILEIKIMEEKKDVGKDQSAGYRGRS